MEWPAFEIQRFSAKGLQGVPEEAALLCSCSDAPMPIPLKLCQEHPPARTKATGDFLCLLCVSHCRN